MPFQSTGPVRRVHHRMGWDGTVYTDTFEGEDPDTGRLEWTEDTTGTSCTIRVEPSMRQPEQRESPAGEDISIDVFVVIDPQEVTVQDGGGETERPSEIVDETDGSRFKVLNARDEHNGMVVCECERMT